MEVRNIHAEFSVSGQIFEEDISQLADRGFKTIICHRPDNESANQPLSKDIEAAAAHQGIKFYFIPVVPNDIRNADAEQLKDILSECEGPVLAYCGSGQRAVSLWALAQVKTTPSTRSVDELLQQVQSAGFNLESMRDRLTDCQENTLHNKPFNVPTRRHDVLVIGAGAGGVAVISSLLKRQPDLDIAVIEPRQEHYYQPGWTLVGAGVFDAQQTMRSMEDVIPANVKVYESEASAFKADQHQVILKDGSKVGYRSLVIAAGLVLDWDAIPGLQASLGSNGVTSNYRFDMAPYTYQLLRTMKKGNAIFTQPAMPIKCAGAPQKAMYLACDHWLNQNVLSHIDVQFCTAGAAMFSVPEYVPALMEYVKKYDIDVNFQTTLTQIDGENKTATFTGKDAAGNVNETVKSFDMIHVCPPQRAPEFISNSELADSAGWVDVNAETLQHKKYENIFAVGDVSNTPNAKTAAAVRKQAPVVAENILRVLTDQLPHAYYSGYGSCPLTVERGKIVLAEFGYGGVLQPTFPLWLINGKQPSRLSWFLKAKLLPQVYWQLMLKGREWLAKPEYYADPTTMTSKQE